MKIAGIAGAIAPSILAKAGTLCRNGATAGSTTAAETVADRTLNYPSGSGSQAIRAGPAFRFGFGLKQANVPSDASIGQKDSAASALSMQFDGINRWPDGSVRWSEMRGLHHRGIPHTGR
jgi:hypothetical protein